MSTQNTPIIAPDQTLTLGGEQVAKWGQPTDPIPTVYATPGEIETNEFRLSFDAAERYALRILNAVRWQRAHDQPSPVASGSVVILPSETKVVAQAEALTLVEYGWTASPHRHLQEADGILARRGLERRAPWREDPALPGQRWTALLYRTTESAQPRIPFPQSEAQR